MEKELLDFATAKVDEMLASPSASAATKMAAHNWKEALAAGKDADDATAALLDAISAKQTSITDLIAFISSEKGAQVFGDAAEGALAHAKERQAKGAQFCDCAACKPCHELLAKFGREKPDVYL